MYLCPNNSEILEDKDYLIPFSKFSTQERVKGILNSMGEMITYLILCLAPRESIWYREENYRDQRLCFL